MKEKIAIVTGASRGVGKAIAKHLAQTGYFVILLARDSTALSQVCDEITNAGGKAVFATLDVSNALEVKSCITDMIHAYGKIDLLINNAAILKRGTTDLPDDEIDELLQINLNGAIYVAKYVAMQMKKQRSGYIINISSLGGKFAACLR